MCSSASILQVAPELDDGPADSEVPSASPLKAADNRFLRVRARWLVARTLLRNPAAIGMRKESADRLRGAPRGPAPQTTQALSDCGSEVGEVKVAPVVRWKDPVSSFEGSAELEGSLQEGVPAVQTRTPTTLPQH